MISLYYTLITISNNLQCEMSIKLAIKGAVSLLQAFGTFYSCSKDFKKSLHYSKNILWLFSADRGQQRPEVFRATYFDFTENLFTVYRVPRKENIFAALE